MRVAVRYAMALAVALALLAHLSGYREFNGSVLAVLVGLSVGLGVLFGKLGIDLDDHRLTPPMLLGASAVALLCGIAVAYALGPAQNAFRGVGDLTVRASPARNPATQGNEIWAKVESADAVSRLMPDVIPEGWREADGGSIVWSGGSPSPVRWKVPYGKDLHLRLTRHGWSGVAEVEWLGQTQRIDLYAPGSGGAVTLPLSGHPLPNARDRVLAAAVRVADVLVLTALFLAALLFVRSRVMRGR